MVIFHSYVRLPEGDLEHEWISIWNMNGLTFGTFGKSITFTKYIIFLQKMGL